MNNKNKILSDDETDLFEIIYIIIRNKKLFAGTILLTLLSIFGLLLLKKPIWEASTTVIFNDLTRSFHDIRKTNLNQFSSSRNRISQFMQFGLPISSDVTKEIISSQKLLNPIFQSIYKDKESSTNKYNKLTFNKWLDQNIRIKLINQTNIFKISYLGKDRQYILNNLTKIVNRYEEYFFREDNIRRLKSKELLVDKLNVYRQKQNKIISDIYKLSLDNGLNISINSSMRISSSIIPNANILSDINRSIKNIDKQIEVIKKLEDKEIYKVEEINLDENMYKKLSEIDILLTEKSRILTNEDPFIKELYLQRSNLIKYINESTVLGLINKRRILLSNLNYNLPNNEVIKKYLDLKIDELDYEEKIKSIQLRLSEISLSEIEKDNILWVLSSPSISESPIYPNYIRYISFAIFSSLSLSFLITFAKEYLFGIVNVPNNLNRNEFILNLGTTPINQNSIISNFINEASIYKFSSCNILIKGNIPSNIKEELKYYLNSNNNSYKVTFTSDLRKLNNNVLTILLIKSSSFNRLYFIRLLSALNNKSMKYVGYILV